jgi:hypothetical protein
MLDNVQIYVCLIKGVRLEQHTLFYPTWEAFIYTSEFGCLERNVTEISLARGN